MKSREISLRTKRFAAEEKRRKVADIEHMIREFEHMAMELDRQVQAEEERTGIRDKSHFAYSTLAKSAAQRRDNLRASIADLQERLEIAIRERDDAWADLDRLATPEAQRDFDALVLPTTPLAPVPLDEVDQSQAPMSRLTRPINLLDCCALALPCGFTRSGLPVSLQIVGRAYEEARVLRIGWAFENATDWHARRPRMPADP